LFCPEAAYEKKYFFFYKTLPVLCGRAESHFATDPARCLKVFLESDVPDLENFRPVPVAKRLGQCFQPEKVHPMNWGIALAGHSMNNQSF